MDDSEALTLFKPGMKLWLIGNCVFTECESEDDAIVLFEMYKEMIGKHVHIEE